MTDWEKEKQNRCALATEQQRQASDPAVSAWVEASAGTGKTKVLSDRVLRLLLSGVKPEKILCLTYTKAAAVNMSNRIAGRLSRWAVTDDAELAKQVRSLLGEEPTAETLAQARRLFAMLLDTPGGMKIQTIHSFYQDILKRFPLEAGISPYFEVMDDRTAAEALQSIKAALLAKIETKPECATAQALAYITTQMSEQTFPKLMNVLTQNRTKILSLLDRSGGSQALAQAAADRLGLTLECREEDIVAAFWEQTDLATAKRFLAVEDEKGRKRDSGRVEGLRQALADKNTGLYINAFFKDGKRWIPIKAVLAADPEIEAWFDAETERVQKLQAKLAAVRLLMSTRAVLALAEDLLYSYKTYKQCHAKADYEDLIVQTKHLLENPQVAQWVLFKLDGGIDNVLIDEAQDTSPDQWAIIKAISDEFFYGRDGQAKNRTVFAVGDCKQSIYSFQGAEPAEFAETRRHFAEFRKQGAEFREVNLDVSFRSTAAVLDVVNEVFAELPAKQGLAEEGQTIRHIPSRIGEAGTVELWPLVEPEKDENLESWQVPFERVTSESSCARLARMIAENIRQQVVNGEKLVSQNRPLRYSDFMILVQRRHPLVEELVRACKNVGVNVTGADRIKLSEQIAVQDLLSLAKFCLLPEDDLTLAEVLKSPLFGLNDDDLFKLCYRREKQSLWQRLRENPEYAATAAILQELLALADVARPFEFFGHVLNTLGGRQKLVAQIGLEAEDGVDEFVNLSLLFEQEHTPSLQLFVEYMEEDDVEIKRELENDQSDAVRIMTVHGSKGLQAPVVIVPDTVRIKKLCREAGALMDKELLFYPFRADDYDENCVRIKQKEQQSQLEEYHRLLYVALTRAEDKLCICGYAGKNKIDESCWYELCRHALQKIGSEEDGKWVYTVRGEKGAVQPPEEKKQPQTTWSKPNWIATPAPEEGPLAKPLAPSRADDADEVCNSPLDAKHPEYFRRGLIIHKLLQFLPDLPPDKRRSAAAEYVGRQGAELPPAEQQRLAEEVLGLLENPRFAPLFGSDSKAEAAIMGEAEGRIISGQIDRLAVLPDKVMIVDYKTNRPAAGRREDVPESYVRQLRAYRLLAEKIYVGKPVETYILWTNTAQMMQIE